MKTTQKLICLALLSTLLFSCEEKTKDVAPWVPLFNGEDLGGWSQKGGTADYEVRDNTIVGITKNNTPNSFLTTDKLYGNFILELEYKVDPSMNSGIQIRSNSYPNYMNGRVHGYQIEIDPSDRAWSAGIYDEARRGWLYDLTQNPEAQNAFKQNEWNHYRIEAIGDTLKTWINKVPAAHLVDEKTAEGFIALQVHSIGDDQKEGTEIAWRNINIITEDVTKYSKKTTLEPFITKNNLTNYEKENGWELLWDGETTKGWRGAKLDSFPNYGWQIKNGELAVLASGGGESEAGGDIITLKNYTDFEFVLDFKLTTGANSGIKYFVDVDMNKGDGSAIGLEYQLLDDAVHPDAKLGNHEGSRTLASLYDLIKADEEKPAFEIGEWNTAKIVSKNNHIEHWLNTIKVLEYERGSDEFKKLVAESKYNVWPSFAEMEQAPILLQDHGDLVYFKNIKIKDLTKN